MYKIFRIKRLLFVFSLLFVGCSVKQPTAQETSVHIENLTAQLIDLNESIDKYEAQIFAKKSILYASNLAKKYKLIRPPLWQNTLVNFGFKKRGLCHEWASDLYVFLKQQHFRTLSFYYVGADIGDYFEHNALAVLAKGDNVSNSIVLDAWRNSGKLYFIKIDKDKKYEWKRRVDLERSKP